MATRPRYDADVFGVDDATLNVGASSHCVPRHFADWVSHSNVRSGTSRLNRKHCPLSSRSSLQVRGAPLSVSNKTTLQERS